MKRSTLLGILLNVCFILSIFTVRYYYAKKEMDFLVKDSTRQEQLIVANESSIDSLSAVTRRLQNLIDTVEALQLELLSYESSTVPFLQEFGNQDNYIKVFGRTGLRIKDNKIVDAKTIADFEGELNLGPPQIEKLDRYEFQAIYPDNEFLNLKIKGGKSEVIKIKPPRNQISIGPMLGVTYNQITGLTEPIWGIGLTYNLIKVWDWK